MTTTVLNAKASVLVKSTDCDTTVIEIENKITDHDLAKYITTQEFNKLTAETFKKRLKQANSVSKTDFDNELIAFNRSIISNKTKYLEVQKKLNSLTAKDFFLTQNFFISNDGSQNMFGYQPTVDSLELKKTKLLIMFLAKNERVYILPNLSNYILFSCIAQNLLDIELK